VRVRSAASICSLVPATSSSPLNDAGCEWQTIGKTSPLIAPMEIKNQVKYLANLADNPEFMADFENSRL
jgi:hypothetical protein